MDRIFLVYPQEADKDDETIKKVRESLKHEGWTIFNRCPCRWDVVDSIREVHDVGMDLLSMAEAGAVCFAPGWKKDKKCRTLQQIAKEYGIRQVYMLDDSWD